MSSIAASSPAKRRRLGRLFGDLKVRPKLMVLHNAFFLVLAATVYFTLIPPFERQVELVERQQTQVSAQSSPSQTTAVYRDLIQRARITLFAVLGGIYIIAVLLLEFVIMPLYVYRPLRDMLDADHATQQGDREHEIIDDKVILDDEIGQIMRSRNATILELRRQEDELEQALQRLEAQDRLVSIGLLSASVAHELNTPLSVLQGSLEMMTETTRDPATLDRLARMLRVTQRLRKISESLVDFSRVRKQDLEPVILRPLVDEAWSLVAIDEKASHAEFRNLVTAEDSVIGNPDRLIQVFVNLLRNALYAIQPSGRIGVQSRRLIRNGKPWIAVTVEDDGPGIPADVLPDLFEAFVSTRLDARGTGLGLTVTEGIVHQHGGAISAANRPGGGACLEVLLPPARIA